MSAPFFPALPGSSPERGKPHGNADRAGAATALAMEPEPEQRFSVEWQVPHAS